MTSEIIPPKSTDILSMHLESRSFECEPEETELAYFGLSKELQEAVLSKQQASIEFQEAA